MNAAHPVKEETRFDQDAQLSDTPAGIHCPTCKKMDRESELCIGILRECQFAGCQRCGGMLFQQETFAMLITHLRATTPPPKKLPKPMDTSQLNVRRHCPTCDDWLETHPYAGPGNSVIDSCPSCHVIWFDTGELTNLVDAPGRR